MRICFVGDSLVAGTGDPECLGWVGRVCAMARRDGYDVSAYNLGVRRETSADIARRWLAEVTPRLPSEFPALVVFSFGNNDTTVEGGEPRVPLEVSAANLQAILTTATARWPVLVIGPMLFPGQEDALRRQLAAEYQRICAERAVPYLDLLATASTAPVWLSEAQQGDGVHPGAGGYQLLADLVRAWPAWQAQLRRAERLE